MTIDTVQAAMAYLLAAAFAVGALVHIIGPMPLRTAYKNWGYPAGFRFVTAAFHVATAALLVGPETRWMGVLLGASVTSAAFMTLARHGEWKKTPASIVLIAALAFTIA